MENLDAWKSNPSQDGLSWKVLQSIDGAGSKEERKMHEFFDGIEGENIEIGDGVKPEDVSEEDAPIIKYFIRL